MPPLLAKPNPTWSPALSTCATLWAPFSHSSAAFSSWLPSCHNHIQVSPVLYLLFSFKPRLYSPKILDARVCTRMPNSPAPQPPLFGTILCEGHGLRPTQAMADGRAGHGEGASHSTNCLQLPSTHPLTPEFLASWLLERSHRTLSSPGFILPPPWPFPHISSHSPASPPHCFTAGVLLDPAVYFLLHPHIRSSETDLLLQCHVRGSQADISRKNISNTSMI